MKTLEEQRTEIEKKKKGFEANLEKNNKNLSPSVKKELETKAKIHVLRCTDIVICTLNYAGNPVLDSMTSEKNQGGSMFTTIIIDEVLIRDLIVVNVPRAAQY